MPANIISLSLLFHSESASYLCNLQTAKKKASYLPLASYFFQSPIFKSPSTTFCSLMVYDPIQSWTIENSPLGILFALQVPANDSKIKWITKETVEMTEVKVKKAMFDKTDVKQLTTNNREVKNEEQE